jgi:tripartite-type tricarboxylate transporter receptor subunit TctC
MPYAASINGTGENGMRNWLSSTFAAAAGVAISLSTVTVRAQEISRPIRIVVPFAPGGFPDRLGRLLALNLSDSLKQRVYVENKPGAGGIVGSAEVAHSAPDGTTLLISSLPSQVLAPLINPKAGLDSIENFSHIAYIGGPPNCFVVADTSKIHSLDDILKSAKTAPMSYGSAGVGTLGHIFAEYVAHKAGLKLIHVPYNGPMIPDILSGTVEFGSITMSTVAGNIQGGKLRVPAVATKERLPDYPDVPTFRELGFDLAAVNWLALSGPAGLPDPLVRRINQDVIKIMDRPDVRAILRQEIIVPTAMSPQDVVQLIKSETKNWAPIVAAAGLQK